MSIVLEPQVQWTAPAPVWGPATNASNGSGAFGVRQPTILRFATDTFMDDFLAILNQDPSQLPNLVAQPETWRAPMGMPAPTQALLEPAVTTSSAARKLARARADKLASAQSSRPTLFGSGTVGSGLALKLYQPAHQRFYLVTACLVCRIPGMPDRVVNTGNQERVSFVVRRLMPRVAGAGTNVPCDTNSCDEYAFVTGAGGSGWQQMTTGQSLQPGEEQLPLFGVNYNETQVRKRRLFAGMVPVGKREAYMGAKNLAPPIGSATNPLQDPRVNLLRTQVTEAWKSLIVRASGDKTKLSQAPSANPAPPSSDLYALIKNEREALQVVSWYLVLDFAKWLQQYLPNVWALVTNQTPPTSPSTAEQAVYNALTATTISAALVTDLIAPDPAAGGTTSAYTTANVPSSLRDALARISPFGANLEIATVPYDRSKPDPKWPSDIFPLADPSPSLNAPQPPDGVPVTDAQQAQDKIDQFVNLIVAALPATTTAPMPAVPAAAVPPMDAGLNAWFVIRCVFERPDCGPLAPPLVSEASVPFQLASFFDPDAPARPIRIALPIDTSPAGLRKFDKNTAFMVSDMLCGQIERAKGMSLGDLVLSVLPWPLHKDLNVPDTGPCPDPSNPGLTLGMICSISIPIITICALIMLMIIVNLLDIIFRWSAWFVLCFPLPLKAKSSS